MVFSYTPRPDIGSSGLGGFLTRQTQVLSKIETKTPDTSAPPVNVLVRRYDLQFGANPAVIGVSKNSGRAQLTQVTECAADKCFKPTLLNWLDTPSTAPNLVASAFVWPDGMPEPVLPDGSQTITDEVRPLGDIDGDGSVEITRLISTSTGSRNFVVSFNASRQVRGYFETAFTSSFASTPADLNNDGRNDVFGIAPGGTANSKRIEGAFWNGSTAACVNGVCPFDSTLLVTKQSGDLCSLAPLPPPSPLLGLELSVQFLDVNGDSLPDLVTASAGACGQNTRGIFIQLNTSTWNGAQSLSTFTLSFGPPIFIPLLGPNELLYRIIDLDGDGTPEILTTKQTTAGLGEPRDLSVYRLNKVTGTYSAAQILQPDLVTVNTDYFIWTDVNGDGLVDLLTPSLGTGGRWTLRLNRGGTFFLVNFDSASDAPLRAGLLQSGATNQPFSPFNLGLVRASDFNADGRSELTVPRDFAERVCGVGYEDLTNGKAEENFTVLSTRERALK